MRQVFECQRANVYWECVQDHVTVHKSSMEHDLILKSGAYDVSARLLAENLTVDDGWVVRKNPDVIVKVADRRMLGSGIMSTGGAASMCAGLAAREGWAQIAAVRAGKMVILSEEMLQTDWMRTAAMLVIAKCANASLFEDVDLAEALNALAQEATGMPPEGQFYYTSGEGTP